MAEADSANASIAESLLLLFNQDSARIRMSASRKHCPLLV